MTSGGMAGAMMTDTATGTVWTKTCQALKRELGDGIGAIDQLFSL